MADNLEKFHCQGCLDEDVPVGCPGINRKLREGVDHFVRDVPGALRDKFPSLISGTPISTYMVWQYFDSLLSE